MFKKIKNTKKKHKRKKAKKNCFDVSQNIRKTTKKYVYTNLKIYVFVKKKIKKILSIYIIFVY